VLLHLVISQVSKSDSQKDYSDEFQAIRSPVEGTIRQGPGALEPEQVSNRNAFG